MLELISMRLTGEVRHKDSILHGAAMRGREEKTPKRSGDFYHPTGDEDLERRRNYRRDHLEQERETSRRYKKSRKNL